MLHLAGLCMSQGEAQRKLLTMITQGSAYRNLEDNVGLGVCFVLGGELSVSQ